ncbi:MAG: hypothetical protein GQ527_04475 [Bacteroidales bacterium]|nr:hypothetical protein [Bacteroidales bacterium]
MKYLSKHIAQVTILFIGFIMVFTASNVKWGDERWFGLIKDDGKGYYAYLPAVFIYDDLNFGFYDSIENGKYRYQKLAYDYRYQFHGKAVNKYYSGAALVQTPFFLVAHYLSESLGYDQDGYSKPYRLSVSIAAIVYLLLGLIFLRQTLLFFDIKESIISLTLLAIVFGTHLFYYAIAEPSMTHVFSFAYISGLIYFSKSFFINPARWKIILIAVFIGIIVLIRPVNIIIVLLFPFLAGSLQSLQSGFHYLVKKNTLVFIGGLFIAAGIIGIQFLIYYLQSGYWLVYSYNDEGFNFLDPHMIDILFSYKKGLFVYTPLTLIASAGAYFLYMKSKFEFYTLTGFFILLTYMLSSWWSWYYGGSFSSRVYIDFLPLFAILLAFILKSFTSKIWRGLFVALLFFIVILNQLQTYQYRLGHIHFVDMNKEKYWEVFPLKSKVFKQLILEK